MNARFNPIKGEDEVAVAVAQFDASAIAKAATETSQAGDANDFKWIADVEEMSAAIKSHLRVMRIPTQQVVPGDFANRRNFNWSSRAFARLVEEIRRTKGNIVPILVRPMPPVKGRPDMYEIVAGHRRHRACEKLQIEVLCLVQVLDDEELVIKKAAENRERVDPCYYEDGLHYKQLMDCGLYPSHRKLAAALGVDHTEVSRSIRLANLPPEVVQAFKDEREIKPAMCTPLDAALEKDREGVICRAQAIAASSKSLSGKQTVDALIGARPEFPSDRLYRLWPIKDRNGKVLARIKVCTEAGGRGIELQFDTWVDHRELTSAVRRVLGLAEASEQDLPPEHAGKLETPTMTERWNAQD